MERFTTGYFTMREEDALEYAKTRLDCFGPAAQLSCKEIGDGNLNYVFRIIDDISSKSIIIKQAGPYARISDQFKVSPDRNRIESEILRLQHDIAEGFVPRVYKYDPIMNCCVMEDLSDHTIMRKALMEHRKFPLFAQHITTFLAKTLLLTSDVVMNHKSKKELVKNFINPELCEITEDLVYTEPFFDCARNDISQETREYASKEIWSDDKLLLETAKLKFEFMTNAQSLIHGDLHTGSIFIKEDSTKVIDPEFAFYGPAGYDIGNIIANLIFAHQSAEATIEDGAKRNDYKEWLEDTIVQVIDLFLIKFKELWQQEATERVAKYQGFQEYYIDNILRDTAAVAGCELCRRIIGIAHVKDITSIEDGAKRLRAEKICLQLGKELILDRANIKTGKAFVDRLKRWEQEIV